MVLDNIYVKAVCLLVELHQYSRKSQHGSMEIEMGLHYLVNILRVFINHI